MCDWMKWEQNSHSTEFLAYSFSSTFILTLISFLPHFFMAVKKLSNAGDARFRKKIVASGGNVNDKVSVSFLLLYCGLSIEKQSIFNLYKYTILLWYVFFVWLEYEVNKRNKRWAVNVYTFLKVSSHSANATTV